MKRSLLLFAFSCLSAFAFAQWNTRASMTNARGQHGAVAHPNGNIYVWGGFTGSNVFTDLEIYNEAGNSWSSGAPIPVGTRGMACALGNDNNIYSFGGFDASHLNISYRYNVVSNTWTPLAPVPTAVWEGTAATAPNGNIIVFGGENAMSLVQIYNPSTDTWSLGAPMPQQSRMHSAITAPNGKIYVIGGWSGSSAYNTVLIYDPVLNSWSTGANMPTARNQFGATLGVDGRIWIIGGKTSGTNNAGPFYNQVEIYDPVSDTWTIGTSLPAATGETEAVTINNGIHLLAGTTGSYNTSNLRFDTPLGINELSELSLVLFPNPASDLLVIELSASSSALGKGLITDMSGRILMEIPLEFTAGKRTEVDIRSLSPGTYLFQVGNEKDRVVKMFMVQ